MRSVYLVFLLGCMLAIGALCCAADAKDAKAAENAQPAKANEAKPAQSGENPAGAQGSKAPDFALTDLAGQAFKLMPAVEKAKVFLLLFGNDTCPFSGKAFARLSELDTKYKDKGLAMAVVHDGPATDSAKQFYEKQKLPCPVAIDSDKKTTDLYKVEAIPTALLIGSDGTVKLRMLYGAELENALAEAFGEKPEQSNKTPAAPGGG